MEANGRHIWVWKTLAKANLLVLVMFALAAPAEAQINYAISGSAAYVTNSFPASGNIVIASTYDGYPVSSISSSAFQDCFQLTSVTIPNSVTRIDRSAFESCLGLVSVIIPSSVTNIGPDAFEYSGLTNVTVPKNATSIGLAAFSACANLTNITVDTGNPSYASAGGVLFNKAGTLLVQYPGGLKDHYMIPVGVTRIGLHAFDSTSVTNVTIPSSVTNIGDFAFQFCDGLQSIFIPDSVTSIGLAPFSACASLTNITVDANNPSYVSAGGVLFNKAGTLLIQYPAGLNGNYAIPVGVASIGLHTFDSSGVTHVTIPNSVTNIGDYAFQACDGLKSITLPDSVTHLGSFAFRFAGLTNVSLPSSLTQIGEYTFQSCAGLQSVTLPDSITNIGICAFQYAGLTNVIIPGSVTLIGRDAFSGCSGLTSVTIANGVTSIGDYAFSFIPLASVTIPSSVTNIGTNAFFYSGLTNNVFFLGNAPSVNGAPGSADTTVFAVASFGGGGETVYYVPGTTGWGTTFGSLPTAQWYQPRPQILDSNHGLGVGSHGFQFTISWATNASVVIETSTNLQDWIPISTNTLVNGTNGFVDANWTNYPDRFYRVRTR